MVFPILQGYIFHLQGYLAEALSKFEFSLSFSGESGSIIEE